MSLEDAWASMSPTTTRKKLCHSSVPGPHVQLSPDRLSAILGPRACQVEAVCRRGAVLIIVSFRRMMMSEKDTCW